MTVDTVHYPGAKITRGPQPWQVLQREADGCAPLALAGTWAGDGPSTVEVRVAREDDGAPVPGCDWQDAVMADHAWSLTLRVPTGGLYKIETRVRLHTAEWRNTGDKIWHVAVGDVWVIAGQSNAVGYGHGPVNDPPALGVSLCGGDEVWRLATHPIFDPTNTRHPANRDSGWVDVSPWLAFAKGILAATGVPVGLIPTALGGSPMDAWDPGNANPYLYTNMVAHIAAAGGRVAGMVWYQGESDCNPDLIPTYAMRFTRMVDDFRARYGTGLPVLTAQLNRYFDNNADGDRLWSQMREVQRRIAQTVPGVAVVPTLDLPLSDGIHTSAAGNVLLGERFALAARGLAYGQQVPWRAADAHGANFATTERTQIRVSFDHVADHLVYLAMRPGDMTVVDDAGDVPVESIYVDGTDAVRITLARPAQGATRVHHAYGANPPTFLRDHLQRPALGFYGLEVAE
jgi:hypothetical protein